MKQNIIMKGCIIMKNRIKMLKKIRFFSGAAAALGFFGMLGAAGGLDIADISFGRTLVTLFAALGLFIIGFISMKYCDDEISKSVAALVARRRRNTYSDSGDAEKRHNIA